MNLLHLKNKILLLFLLSCFTFQAQVTDIDGNSYDTVRIGTQTWMAENLNVATFRNGDPIPEAKTKEEWMKAVEMRQAAWCYYENDPLNGDKYGKLYNWFAVKDVRGLAPLGYHVSSKADWNTLIKYVDLIPWPDDWNEGGGVATKLKSTSDWADWYAVWEETGQFFYYNSNGNNVSGLNCMPAGNRFDDADSESSEFWGLNNVGSWWCSDYYNYEEGISYHITRMDSDVINDFAFKSNGFSVRCIKN